MEKRFLDSRKKKDTTETKNPDSCMNESKDDSTDAILHKSTEEEEVGELVEVIEEEEDEVENMYDIIKNASSIQPSDDILWT